MSYVLIAIVVFHSTAGITSETIQMPFQSKVECEAARDDLGTAINKLKGTLGRALVAQCVERAA